MIKNKLLNIKLKNNYFKQLYNIHLILLIKHLNLLVINSLNNINN